MSVASRARSPPRATPARTTSRASGICLGLQAMTIDFARNVMKLTGANSTEMDPDTPHPVIDLMHDQRDVSDKGGTQRLGAYYAILEPGTIVHRGLRRAGGQRAPSAPLRVERVVEAAPRSCRTALQRDLARSSTGRVHRARRSSVLGRDTGASGVQEPARPSSPAVPRARCRSSGPSRQSAESVGATPEQFASADRRARGCDADRRRERFRHLGDRIVHQGYIWHVAVGTFEAPDGDAVRARHRPLAWRGRRRAADASTPRAMPTVVLVRQYRAPYDDLVIGDPRRHA